MVRGARCLVDIFTARDCIASPGPTPMACMKLTRTSARSVKSQETPLCLQKQSRPTEGLSLRANRWSRRVWTDSLRNVGSMFIFINDMALRCANANRTQFAYVTAPEGNDVRSMCEMS